MDKEKRQQQLRTFEKFIDETNSYIDGMLSNVGWNREYLEKERGEMVLCPLNTEHRMPKKSLSYHIHSCAWHKEGYHDLDIPLPQNVSKDSDTFITLGSSNIASIIRKAKSENDFLITGDVDSEERPIPKTSDRLTSEYTTDERRILYDHVIVNTRAPGDVTVEDVQLMGDMKKDDAQRPKSKLELLIEQRDAKRRRISYRKKVHTNRKTQTEILREVIQNQMELVEQIIKGECDDENDKASIGGIGDSQSFSEDVKSEPTEGESIVSRGRERKNFHVESERKFDREFKDSSGNHSFDNQRRNEVSYRSDKCQSSVHSGYREEWDKWRNEKYHTKHYHRGDRYREDWQKRRDHKQFDYVSGGRRDHHSRLSSRYDQERAKDCNEGNHSKSSRSEQMTSVIDEEIEEQYRRKYRKSRHYGNYDNRHEEKSSYSEHDFKNSTAVDDKCKGDEDNQNHGKLYESEKHKKKSKKSKKKKSHKHKSKSKSKKKTGSGSILSRSPSVDSSGTDGNESYSA